MTYKIVALYRFTPVADPADLRARLLPEFRRLNICGTLLVASEGVNGTLAGLADDIDAMLGLLARDVGLDGGEVKFSSSDDKPFHRLKIRLKRELITFKQPSADPAKMCGTYVEPRDWNALIADPETVLIDTRNIYETKIGIFAGARDPGIEKFTDFAAYVREKLDPAKHKKIAMYCTGGIRCEKASAFMRAEGFAEVYHLKGGILKYLEEIPPADSRWQGDCYVFDKRMGVGHGLQAGDYAMCYCCGWPLTADDRKHPHYEPGVSCAHCHGRRSDEDKARFRMRQRQMDGF